MIAVMTTVFMKGEAVMVMAMEEKREITEEKKKKKYLLYQNKTKGSKYQMNNSKGS
jgi:hypothetical protein